MNAAQEKQFDIDFNTFVENIGAVIMLPPDGSGVTKSGLPFLREYVRESVRENGGYSSLSVFEISLKELVAVKEIVVRAIPKEEEQVSDNIPRDARAYHALPVSQVIRRYRAEPAFKDAIDKLVREGRI